MSTRPRPANETVDLKEELKRESERRKRRRRTMADDAATTATAAAAPPAPSTDRVNDQASTSGAFIIHKVKLSKKGDSGKGENSFRKRDACLALLANSPRLHWLLISALSTRHLETVRNPERSQEH